MKKWCYFEGLPVIVISVPYPGSGAFLTPGSSVFWPLEADGKKSGEARIRIINKMACMLDLNLHTWI